MMNVNAFRPIFLLLLLPLVINLQEINGYILADPVVPVEAADAADSADSQWNYDQQGADWTGTCATGQRQSPIELVGIHTITRPFIPRLGFTNYDIPLQGPLTLTNNGHSANLDLPLTQNGERPYINRGLLNGKYDAIGVHFHWGSNATRGSEHAIRGGRYDVEMHIVHRNKLYATTDEATRHADGLAVLGVFLKITDYPDRRYPGLEEILNAVPHIVSYGSSRQLENTLTLDQLLGDVDRRDFYTYSGSLTTPVCSEVVSWYVFKNALPISRELVSKLWQLENDLGNPLTNNYRKLQNINRRLVYYRPFGPFA